MKTLENAICPVINKEVTVTRLREDVPETSTGRRGILKSLNRLTECTESLHCGSRSSGGCLLLASTRA